MTDPDAALEAFWEAARRHARLNLAPGYFGPTALESVVPPAWSFGNTPEMADELLGLVLDGVKTATASDARWYAEDGEPMPRAGDLSILLDGAGHPRALIVTTAVAVVPFDEVSAAHAHAEGEGDRSLEHWRAAHERFFTADPPPGARFSRDMPVVTETFELLYAGESGRRGDAGGRR